MTHSLDPSLESLADWIHRTDPHAAQHLELLQQLRQLRSQTDTGSVPQNLPMAAKLERWRYQWLNEHGKSLTPEDDALCRALDLAANELAGRASRPPRLTRQATRDPSLDSGAVAQGMACLDPDTPTELVARQAAERTWDHFGRECMPDRAVRCRFMHLYAPLYLSNHCINHCVYCGFRHPNPILRKHLTGPETLREAAALRQRGFRHLLLVAGDFPSLTSTDYYTEILRMLSAEGFELSIEIAPQSTNAYSELHGAGARGVTLYQETYNEDLYAIYHPRGSKVSYHWRLEGIERAAEAGIQRLGLGILVGLADPREDLLALLRHARYLQSRFPDCTLAFSLPRIREAPAGFETPYPVDDETFVRMYCALRVAFPKAVLVLSTREAPDLRNRLAKICITQMSAGSSTSPGGYETPDQRDAGQQFPICDHRTPAEVVRWLEESGFHIAWSLDEPTT